MYDECDSHPHCPRCFLPFTAGTWLHPCGRGRGRGRVRRVWRGGRAADVRQLSARLPPQLPRPPAVRRARGILALPQMRTWSPHQRRRLCGTVQSTEHTQQNVDIAEMRDRCFYSCMPYTRFSGPGTAKLPLFGWLQARFAFSPLMPLAHKRSDCSPAIFDRLEASP